MASVMRRRRPLGDEIINVAAWAREAHLSWAGRRAGDRVFRQPRRRLEKPKPLDDAQQCLEAVAGHSANLADSSGLSASGIANRLERERRW